MCWKPVKIKLFDWIVPWKFLIFIIQFSWGKADQESSASFVGEFGQMLPFSSTHLTFFFLISVEICQEIELIFITYVLILEFWKRLGKTNKNCSFRIRFGPKLGQHGPHLKSSSIFCVEIAEGDHKLSRTFYFIKIS